MDLWHGKPQEALSKLELLMMNVTDSLKRKKLADLYDYLNRNQAYQLSRTRAARTHLHESRAESHRINY